MNLEEKIVSLQQQIEALSKMVVPPGAVQAFATVDAPPGWLICDGRLVRRKDYPRLFGSIGETFGKGDGDSTFQLPDLEGLFIRGWDSWGNIDPERSFGSIQEDAFQGHRHAAYGHTHKGNTNYTGGHSHDFPGHKVKTKSVLTSALFGDSYSMYEAWPEKLETESSGNHRHSFDTEKSKEIIGEPVDADAGTIRTDVETRPKNISLLYCIKY